MIDHSERILMRLDFETTVSFSLTSSIYHEEVILRYVM